VSPAH